MQSHEYYWVDQAFLIQEGFHLSVLVDLVAVVIELDLVEVSLGVVELIKVIGNIPFWEVGCEEELGELEGLVVCHGQHVFLCYGVLYYSFPDRFIGVCAEEHVVY